MPKGYSVSIRDSKLVARLYDTDIVAVEGKTITLNSGGWKTNHTKKCMNLALRDVFGQVSVYQKQGDWYVSFLNEFNTMQVVSFQDGLKLEL